MTPLKVTWKEVFIISIMILIITCLCSCAASNKTHWNKVHPHGGWAGKHWIHGIDKTKPVK